MENGVANAKNHWRFKGNEELTRASSITVRGVLNMVMENLDQSDTRPVVPMGHGDPSGFPSFRIDPFVENAICDALRSAKFNGYSSTVGMPEARGAVADYLSKDLPYNLSPDDVFLTIGCTQALEAIITVVARPNGNILLPKPGYPYYEARSGFSHLEIRHYDLLPENGWEVDLAAVEALSDENTVAIVIINPGNPCGNVFKYQHLKKLAEKARDLGILVISDEVYGHLTYGSSPFVPMGVFSSIAPVITIGSISKRFMVPGWKLGWLVANDPDGILLKQGIIGSIKGFLNITSDPVTFIQGGIPKILKDTPSDFFLKVVKILGESAESCYYQIQEMPCISCPSKPEGSMFALVKLELPLLNDITDDLDFCCKLAKEESVVILPGVAVGIKNWLRLSFAIEPSLLRDGLNRMKAFCQRHSKKQ